jgi:hypothetical protein
MIDLKHAVDVQRAEIENSHLSNSVVVSGQWSVVSGQWSVVSGW